jgi:hypothetical protein
MLLPVHAPDGANRGAAHQSGDLSGTVLSGDMDPSLAYAVLSPQEVQERPVPGGQDSSRSVSTGCEPDSLEIDRVVHVALPSA